MRFSMATTDLVVGGQSLEEIEWTWWMRDGRYRPGPRGDGEGCSTQIETDVVLAMLSLIESGATTAAEVRALLCQSAAEVAKDAQQPEEPMRIPGPRPASTLEQDDRRLVYVLSSEVSPHVLKIGVTGNLEQRIKTLQTGSGFPLCVRWTSPGGGRLEEALHDEFRGRAVGGEWFDFGDVDEPVQTIQRAAGKLLRRFERKRNS